MIVSLAVAVILCTTGIVYVWPFQIDDSYISMRYANNLASGYGLVFNPGGPRIEGYTNLLLVLIEALLIRLGTRELWPLKILLVGCCLITLAAISWYGCQRLGQARSWLWQIVPMAVALTATSSPLLLWTVSGMETALFVLLVCVGIILYSLFLSGHLRRQLQVLLVDIVFVVSTLARPEGLLFRAVTLCHTLIVGAIRRGKPLTWARVAGILTGLILLAAYGWWKQHYFGHLLPATYLAKQTTVSLRTFVGGGLRLMGFLAINGNLFVVMVILAALVLAVRRGIQIESPFLYIAALASAYLVYLVSLGFRIAMDDAYRFHVPMVPLMSLLVLEGALACHRDIRRNWSAWMCSCLVAIVILVPLRFYDLWSAWEVDLNWGVLPTRIPAQNIGSGLRQAHIALGCWLRANAPSDAVIVLWDAGAIPYFSGLRTIDTWSLTDPQLLALNRALASAGSDVERERIRSEMRSYVLSLDPEYIVQDGLSLLEDPQTRARYRKVGSWTYQNWYLCGHQQACRYILEPWERRDIR